MQTNDFEYLQYSGRVMSEQTPPPFSPPPLPTPPPPAVPTAPPLPAPPPTHPGSPPPHFARPMPFSSPPLPPYYRMVWDPQSSDYGSFQSHSTSPEDDRPVSRRGLVVSASPPPTPSTPSILAPPANINMRVTDLYQSQPLLPTGSAENGHVVTVSYSDNEESNDRDLPSSNGIVKVTIPSPQQEEPRFPKEKWKTFVAFMCLAFSFILSTTSLSLTHERMLERNTYSPLPDIFFDYVPAMDWALNVSEIIIMLSTNITMIIILSHRHRYIVFRRMFLLISLLYMMRAVTMYVTVLPMSSTTYYCSPKANSTSPTIVASRVLTLISGMGLSINGKQTFCGDFIFSGHTAILTMCCLLIQEYAPKRLYLLPPIIRLTSVIGVVMVLVAHGHYTIDVIIAYWVTTRIFWMYHTMANNTKLKQYGPANYLSRLWWYPLFRYFECNVGVPLPRQYDWPLPWPRRFLHKPPNRDS